MRPWNEVLELTRHCEATGWDGVYFADHFMPNGPDPTPLDGDTLECWSVLAGLASAVPRLRLSPLVTSVTYRHPAVLAKIAAAVDQISDGRLLLGIGAGWQENEHSAYGIELGSARQRSDRLEEACQVLTGLLSQETTDFEGTYYRLRDARCEPKGPQRPHPPICIGGSGERRTLRTAARYAQHWNFLGGTPEEFARKRDVLHAHCGDIGRDPKEITLSSHVWLNPELERTVDDVAALAEEGLDLAIVYLPPPHSPAVLAPLAQALAPLA